MSYICMIVDGAYPNDIRVRKQAEALAEVGKKVLVVCPKKSGDAEKEIINNVEVLRIGNNYSHSKKGIFDSIESITNINYLFFNGLKKVFQNYSIDFLHVHDLPLAGTGYVFKNQVKKAIFLDLHENFPEAMKTWFMWKKSKLLQIKNKLLMNPKLWAKKEKKYCEKYDKVICVVEEMKEKLVNNFNIDESKLVVVSNHEKKDFDQNFENTNSSDKTDSFKITYVGGFGPHRGLHTAIKAMDKIKKSIPNAKLVLVGKGSVDVEEKLRAVVREYKVKNVVEFAGYKPFAEVSQLMQNTDVNIIPHLSNGHTDNTIPHKLFQIMMSKSLLLVSSCKPLKRIVETYDAGVVFEADNSKDFAAKIIDIYNNSASYLTKIENAYNAVMQVENWENESKKLIELYNSYKN